MVRTISSNALNTLAQQLGNEPINIVEVDWADGIVPRQYADRTIPNGADTIPGKVVEIGDVDDAIDITTYNNTSKQVSITLDDTDGSIKALFDSYDSHKRTVRIYQWFTGLAMSDMFLVFTGRINTPISWSERDRTVKITALAQIEDKELGFSAEEGNFPYIPSDLVGKAWPMVFGTVYDYPALHIPFGVSGITLQGVGILTDEDAYLNSPLYGNGTNIDYNLNRSIAKQMLHWGVLNAAAGCWMGVDSKKEADYQSQANKIMEQLTKAANARALKEECMRWKREQQWQRLNEEGLGANPVQILGGEDFPQNTPVEIQIGTGYFWGSFQGQWFYITSAEAPQQTITLEQYTADLNARCPFEPLPSLNLEWYDYRANIPCGGICDIDQEHPCQTVAQGYFAGMVLPIIPTRTPLSGRQYWAPAGSKVLLQESDDWTYVASITPGTVLSVKAYRTIDGVRQLTVVPSDYYTIATKTYGSITATVVQLSQPLSLYADTVSSEYLAGVGGLVGRVVHHLPIVGRSEHGGHSRIHHRELHRFDLRHDELQHGARELAPFPSNFPILSRKNVIAVLKEIAFQARCAFWIEDDVIYLKYLPAAPTAVDTIALERHGRGPRRRNRVDADREPGHEDEREVAPELFRGRRLCAE